MYLQVCMCGIYACAQGLQEVASNPLAMGLMNCPAGCWEQNSGPVEEQEAITVVLKPSQHLLVSYK